MKLHSFVSLLSGAVMALMSTAQAGVTAERTRVVLPLDRPEVSLMLANLNPYPVLTQVWVNDGQPGNTPEMAKAPVMPLPPVFQLAPQQTQTLRLLRLQHDLPTDRESLYWLNIHEVPPTPEDVPNSDDALQVTVTMQTQMKVIVRPPKLSQSLADSAAALQFRLVGNAMTITNDGPHYISLAYLQMENAQTISAVEDGMLSPFSSQTVQLQGLADSTQPVQLRYGWIDDDGMVHDESQTIDPMQ